MLIRSLQSPQPLQLWPTSTWRRWTLEQSSSLAEPHLPVTRGWDVVRILFTSAHICSLCWVSHVSQTWKSYLYCLRRFVCQHRTGICTHLSRRARWQRTWIRALDSLDGVTPGIFSIPLICWLSCDCSKISLTFVNAGYYSIGQFVLGMSWR